MFSLFSSADSSGFIGEPTNEVRAEGTKDSADLTGRNLLFPFVVKTSASVLAFS